jgi:prepilin-type N-terminal cleavage/methylation domain-containing protein
MYRNKQINSSLKDIKHQAAFTLVEMLLVLVILATLAAIVIPKFAGRSQQAKRDGVGFLRSRQRLLSQGK